MDNPETPERGKKEPQFDQYGGIKGPDLDRAKNLALEHAKKTYGTRTSDGHRLIWVPATKFDEADQYYEVTLSFYPEGVDLLPGDSGRVVYNITPEGEFFPGYPFLQQGLKYKKGPPRALLRRLSRLLAIPMATIMLAGRRLGLRVFSLFLLAGGLVLIGLVAGYLIYSARAGASVASVSQKAPEDEAWLESLPPAPTPPALNGVSPLPEATPSSQEEVEKEPLPPVHIFVPGVGIDAQVVEMKTVWKKDRLFWDIPDEAVGLFQGSPYPGEKGNVLMTGHKSSYFRGGIAVFKDLIKVELGDAIYIYSPNEWFLYRVVEKKVILPEEVELKPSDQPILTLITCEPEYVYNLRLVITAKLTKQGPLSKPLVH